MVWREGGKGWYGEGYMVRGGIERRGLGVVWRGGKGWYREKGVHGGNWYGEGGKGWYGEKG